MAEITPFLWFNDKAEEAAGFYVSIFKNSSIENISRYGDAGPGPKGAAMVVEFKLNGQDFMALNGFQPGEPSLQPGNIALFVNCDAQAELDELWDKLSSGGSHLQCGWVRDKYGFAWNIVPAGLSELIGGLNPEKAQAAMEAMLQMEKLDIHELRRAYENG
ncbi:MAG: VOC family protein [Candidatus Baltobacteraceae bacterium]